jgi:hypothetical protein
MKSFKGLVIGLLVFFLFLSLSALGSALLIKQTIFNPNFITSQLDKIDVTTIVEEFISEQDEEETFSAELETTLVNTVAKFETPVKEQVSTALSSTFDYLQGKKESPELALPLKNTFFNSAFVASLMEELDLPLLAEEFISQQEEGEDLSEELETALINTITEFEPLIKERISTASGPIFDYLLGESQSIDLALTLRNTFLNSDFVIALVNELDIPALASEFLGEQLLEDIPKELEFLIEKVHNAITDLELTIKTELITAADPILNYLLGESQGITIVISLEPVIERLEDAMRETFLETMRTELSGLPLPEIEQYFDDYFRELTAMIPATFELDESLFDTEIPAQITDALTEAEDSLAEARQDIIEVLTEAEELLEDGKDVIGYFQLGYRLLIGLVVLLIAGIVLLNREVKGTTRKLGIVFLTYGAIEYAGILVGKYFLNKVEFPWAEIPSSFKAQLPQLVSDFVSSLQWFSLGLLIGGAVLIAISFVYPKWRKTES